MDLKDRKFHERIVCADGFNMSVQAFDGAYCTPRQNRGPWTEVEIGYPSDREDLIMEYIDVYGDGDGVNPTGTVYAYVPQTIVSMVIKKHGGLVSGERPLGGE